MFRNAEAYERFMGRWSRLLAPALVDFADLPNEGDVLDIGSGTGALALAIAEKKPACRVVGIDPSEEYVAYATGKGGSQSRVRFEAGDAQRMRFGDATFSGCSSLLVFNFIPDPRKAIKEARRVTQPGGGVSAAVWDYGEGMGMLRTFWDAAADVDPAAEQRDENHMPLCRRGELPRLWDEGGLDQIEEQPLEITTRFESFGDYWEPFRLGQGPAGAYVSSLGDDKAERLRDAVKKRLGLQSEAVAFSLPARAWAVRGVVR